MTERVHAGRSADAKDAKNAADTYGRHHTGENALEMIERIRKGEVGAAAAREARPATPRKVKLENGRVVDADEKGKGAPRSGEATVALKPRTSDAQPETQPQENVAYENLSDEDKDYLVEKVTDELNEIHATHATAEDHVYNRRVGELKQALLRDGGITREQIDEIIEDAKDRLYGDDAESEAGEPTPHDATAPADADDNIISRMTDREKARYAKFTSEDYTKKNKEAKIDKVVSKSEERASLIERAKWFTLKGGVIFSAISAVDRFRENRSEKFQRKIEGMTVAERKTAIEKKEKWTKRALYLGAGAASLYYLGSRGHVLNYAGSGLSWVNDHTFHFGSHEGGSPIDAKDGQGDDKKGAGSFRVADEAASGNIMKYHNTDAQFFDFAHKQHHGDMGPSLIANTDHAKDTVNGVYLPGYADWMERNKSNPTGLANLVSGLKLDGHGDTFTDRNQLANTLHGDPNAQMKYDEMIQNALKDPKQFKVEEFKITTPYRTTYGYEVNGREMIGNEEHVDYGGTAFKITDSKGVTTYWRKDCGGYQQIWLEPRPAPVQQQQYVQPVYNYVAPAPRGQTGTGSTPVPVAEKPGASRPTPAPTPTPAPKPTPGSTPPPTPTPTPTPAPKDPRQDINVNSGLPGQVSMGSTRVGSGAPQSAGEVRTPGSTYQNPQTAGAGKPSTDTAPGASAATGRGADKPAAQAGSNPSSSGASGAPARSSGNVAE